MEGGKTNIYVKGQLFNQCKFLLLEIPIDKVNTFDDIESIDEAAEKLDQSLEFPFDGNKNIISPIVEFWGHCSNLQIWVEMNYNTRILHRNIAFPLLRKLTKVGDLLARKVFNEEVLKRFSTGNSNVMEFLIQDGYLNFLDDKKITTLLESMDLTPEILLHLKELNVENQFRKLIKEIKRCNKKENLHKLIDEFFILFKKIGLCYELDIYDFLEEMVSVLIKKNSKIPVIREIVNQRFLNQEPLGIALVIIFEIILELNDDDLETLLTESKYNFFERIAELVFLHNETTEKVYKLFTDQFSLLSIDLFVWLKYDRTDILKKGLIKALKNESNSLAINCIFIQEIYKVFEPQEMLSLLKRDYISNKISKILNKDRYLSRNFTKYLQNEDYVNPNIEQMKYSLEANLTTILSIFDEIEYKKNYKIDAFSDFISLIKGTEPMNRKYSLIKAKLNDVLNSINTIDYDYKSKQYHLAAFSRLIFTINKTKNYLGDYFRYIYKNNNKE